MDNQTKITYAKVNGPPDDWLNLGVIDLATGNPVSSVIEIDSAAGWLMRFQADEQDRPFICSGDPPCAKCCALNTHARVERLEGNFQIVRR